MQTFVMLTRLTPEAVRSPRALEELERRVTQHVRDACPHVEWIGSYAVLGPYDYVDIFRAPNLDTATKVSAIVRTYGHAQTETWAPRSGTTSRKSSALSRKRLPRLPPDAWERTSRPGQGRSDCRMPHYDNLVCLKIAGRRRRIRRCQNFVELDLLHLSRLVPWIDCLAEMASKNSTVGPLVHDAIAPRP